MNKILALFFCLFLITACEKAPTPTSEFAPGGLTASEKEFRDVLPTLRVGGDADYPPFVFLENGKLTGVAVDILDEVTKKLGIKYEIAFVGQRATMLQLLQDKKIDVTLASRTSTSRPYLTVSQPYQYSRGAIVIRRGFDIGQVKQIGAGRGYASVTWLKLNRPDVEVVEFEDDATCLRTLRASKIEACIMGREIVFFLADRLKYPITDFELTPTPYDYFLSFGVHVDDPKLASLLSKGIGMIPGTQRKEILQKWMKEPDS